MYPKMIYLTMKESHFESHGRACHDVAYGNAYHTMTAANSRLEQWCSEIEQQAYPGNPWTSSVTWNGTMSIERDELGGGGTVLRVHPIRYVGWQARALSQDVRGEVKKEVTWVHRFVLAFVAKEEIKKEIRARDGDEIRDEIKEDLHDELWEEVKEEIRKEDKEELREEIRTEMEDEMRVDEEDWAEIIEKVKREIKEGDDEELLQELMDEIKTENFDELRKQIVSNLDSNDETGLWDACKQNVLEERPQELRDAAKEDLMRDGNLRREAKVMLAREDKAMWQEAKEDLKKKYQRELYANARKEVLTTMYPQMKQLVFRKVQQDWLSTLATELDKPFNRKLRLQVNKVLAKVDRATVVGPVDFA